MGRFEDLSGQMFGRLTALYRTENKGKQTIWLCKCSCGILKEVRAGDLKSGRVKSCGCLKSDISHSQLEQLFGQRFGRLTVKEQADPFISQNGEKKARWLCICDCGKETIVRADYLKQGRTMSCGCYSKEALAQANTIHGMSESRLFKIWCGMKQRCNDKNCKNYPNYGGRGIKICEEWNKDFSTFFDWAMSHGYEPSALRGDCTIDRINNDGNYEPSNCRWVDMKVQASNKRNNKK